MRLGKTKDKLLETKREIVRLELEKERRVKPLYERYKKELEKHTSALNEMYLQEKILKKKVEGKVLDLVESKINELSEKPIHELSKPEFDALMMVVDVPTVEDLRFSVRSEYVVNDDDVESIPREYLSVDKKKLKQGLKEGKEIPGTKLEYGCTISVLVKKD